MSSSLDIPKSFARFRKYKGLTISALCQFLGIKQGSYTYEANGKNNIPSAARVFEIAENYQVSTDYLLGLTDDPRPVNQILAESANGASNNLVTTSKMTLEDLKAEIEELKELLSSQGLKVTK